MNGLIRVTLRNNVGFIVDGQRRATVSYDVDPNMTVGDFMNEHADVIYSVNMTPMLNGVTIDDEIMGETFADRANGLDVVYMSYTKNSEGNC